MTDLDERLRGKWEWPPSDTMEEAATEITRLRAEVERLRAALKPLACTCAAKHQAECSRSEVNCPFWNARAALGDTHE